MNQLVDEYRSRRSMNLRFALVLACCGLISFPPFAQPSSSVTFEGATIEVTSVQSKQAKEELWILLPRWVNRTAQTRKVQFRVEFFGPQTRIALPDRMRMTLAPSSTDTAPWTVYFPHPSRTVHLEMSKLTSATVYWRIDDEAKEYEFRDVKLVRTPN